LLLFLLMQMSETEANYFARIGMTEQRRLYKEVFGEKSESRQKHAERDYQAKLLAQQYPNGGKLRDYQAEGVAWMISNFLNQRSSILADEMGTFDGCYTTLCVLGLICVLAAI